MNFKNHLPYKKQQKEKLVLLLIAMFTLLLFSARIANGATSSSVPLPWEGPLAALARSFTGPAAKAVALISIVTGLGPLMLGGGDFTGWGRWMAYILVAAGTLGGAGNIVNALGLTGAVV